MPEYRRIRQPGGMYFLTIVTAGRRPLLGDAVAIACLRKAVTWVKREMPFRIHGAVILPDHAHFIWELPRGDVDYSKRVGMIKVNFTKSFLPNGSRLPQNEDSKASHRESGIWQRRFWEHTIRDETDFQRHMDYIHFNPIKHGLAKCAHAWLYSSFRACVRRRLYTIDWCCACGNRAFEQPDFEDLEESTGE
ncbi:MAG: transposase [Phycisphaerales bacterium]|nr:transposase [Phycisphaerales bacterium]